MLSDKITSISKISTKGEQIILSEGDFVLSYNISKSRSFTMLTVNLSYKNKIEHLSSTMISPTKTEILEQLNFMFPTRLYVKEWIETINKGISPKIYNFESYVRGEGRQVVKVGEIEIAYHIFEGLHPTETYVSLEISHKLGKAYKSKSLTNPTGKEILQSLNFLVPTNKEVYSALQNTIIYRAICDRAWKNPFSPDFDAIQAKLDTIIGKN